MLQIKIILIILQMTMIPWELLTQFTWLSPAISPTWISIDMLHTEQKPVRKLIYDELSYTKY